METAASRARGHPGRPAPRTVKVVPIDSENSLRNRDWVEDNLRKVTEATKGRVAYVYVPNTASDGFNYFKRYFFPQTDREGTCGANEVTHVVDSGSCRTWSSVKASRFIQQQ